MKTFKKNKDPIYLVERVRPRHVVIAAFGSFDRAEEYKACCEQDYIDTDWNPDDFEFKITISPYYNE